MISVFKSAWESVASVVDGDIERFNDDDDCIATLSSAVNLGKINKIIN